MHLIGKEIVRQHAIYWPAFLMAAGLPLPRQIVSHGWWLMEGAKMSKSRGNVVRPQGYIDRFSLDAFRYFVFREMVFGQDANFTDEAFLTRYNADLANDLGNLVSRATTMIHRYCAGVWFPLRRPRRCFRKAWRSAKSCRSGSISCDPERSRRIRDDRVSTRSLALREIWEAIGAANRYIVTREPWGLAKDPARRAELDTALYVSADMVRVIAELLRPFMPGTAERALRMLGIEPGPTSWTSLARGTLGAGTRLGETGALFPRIEQTVEELRQMADDQHPGTQHGTKHRSTPAPHQHPSTQHRNRGTAPPQHQHPGPSPRLDRRLHEDRTVYGEGSCRRARAEVEQTAEAPGGHRRGAANHRCRHRRGVRAGKVSSRPHRW